MIHREKKEGEFVFSTVNDSYKGQIRRISKLYTMWVLILPVTTIYASPLSSISIGEIIILFMMVVCFFDMFYTKTLYLDMSPFLFYLLYALIISVLCGGWFTINCTSYSMSDSVERMFRDGFYFAIIVMFSPKYFDFEFGKKILEKISFFLCAFVITQFLVYLATRIYIPGVIPWLKTTISGGFTGAELSAKFVSNASIDGFVRAPGFFSEPAVVAQFLSVSLLCVLFPIYGKTEYKKAILYSVTMLTTFSVNAYVALFVCWGLWTIYSNRGNRDKIIRIILFIILAIVGFVVLMKNDKTASVINRLIELKNGGRTSGSSVLRVVRGMAFYAKMPLGFQILGSGFGNFVQFKSMYDINTIYEMADEYMNTNAYVLISSGIIGFILYITALFRSAKGKIILSSMIAIIVLVFGLSSSIYSSAVYAIMLTFLIAAPKKEDIL